MGEVIDINRNILINYSGYCENDYYLKITVINALNGLGYQCSPDGVIEFQKDYQLDITGIIGDDELITIILTFDQDNAQEILSYINKKYLSKNKPKKKISTGKIIFFLAWCAFFMGAGFIWFTNAIYKFICNIIN